MKVTYSPESLEDLRRVVEFVEPQNPFAARRIAIGIQEGVERLKSFPFIGLPVTSAIDPNKIRDLQINKYTLRYLIEKQRNQILRVWHNRENKSVSEDQQPTL